MRSGRQHLCFLARNLTWFWAAFALNGKFIPATNEKSSKMNTLKIVNQGKINGQNVSLTATVAYHIIGWHWLFRHRCISLSWTLHIRIQCGRLWCWWCTGLRCCRPITETKQHSIKNKQYIIHVSIFCIYIFLQHWSTFSSSAKL